jgi:hypothetical protein
VSTAADTVADDGHFSLREAITSANLDAASGAAAGECAAGAGADTVTLPSGFFELSRPGAIENNNVTGDLDVGGDTTIAGASSGTTTIYASKPKRVRFRVTTRRRATPSRRTPRRARSRPVARR